MHYGNRLKWLIKNKGFTQKDVAVTLGVPETTLSDWTVKEFPPLEAVESICGILQIPVSRFFAEDTDQFIEVSTEEMQLIKSFGEFTEERQRELLRVIEILKGW
jgi:transcriptional regulator with XRE-family HTH domain